MVAPPKSTRLLMLKLQNPHPCKMVITLSQLKGPAVYSLSYICAALRPMVKILSILRPQLGHRNFISLLYNK